MTHVVAHPHRPLFLPEPLLSQLSDPGCSVEALAAASFLVPALSFSQVAHQDRFCVSNYILVMSTVDPGSVLRKPVTNGVWGPGHPLPDWQRGPISSGIWHMDSPWHKVAAQLLTVLLAVAWENVRGGEERPSQCAHSEVRKAQRTVRPGRARRLVLSNSGRPMGSP